MSVGRRASPTLTLLLPRLRNPAGGHVINTNCSAVHTRQALCCKMSVEYDKFIESGRKYVAVAPRRPGESPGLGRPAQHPVSPPSPLTRPRS